MVILPDFTTFEGKTISASLSPEQIDKLKNLTKERGAEIVRLLKTGSAYFAPSQAVLFMIKNIIENKNEILCCSSYLKGQYGVNDIYIGVPARITNSGVSEVIELKLEGIQKEQFLESCRATKDLISKLDF